MDQERGLLIIEHNVARHTLIVPHGPGSPFQAHQFQSNRWTRCYTMNPSDPVEITEIDDDWRMNGRCAGPYEQWHGNTFFLFQGFPAPRGFPGLTAPPAHGPEPEPSPGSAPDDNEAPTSSGNGGEGSGHRPGPSAEPSGGSERTRTQRRSSKQPTRTLRSLTPFRTRRPAHGGLSSELETPCCGQRVRWNVLAWPCGLHERNLGDTTCRALMMLHWTLYCTRTCWAIYEKSGAKECQPGTWDPAAGSRQDRTHEHEQQ